MFSCPFPMGQCWTKVDHWIHAAVSKLKKTYRSCSKTSYENDGHLCGELAGGNVHLITTMDKWEEKIAEATRDAKIVVANFSASWCTPCRTIARSYIELADKYPSLIFLTVDVDELAELSTSWDIKATPTFLFLKNGQQVDKFVGANKAELQEKAMSVVESIMRSAKPSE